MINHELMKIVINHFMMKNNEKGSKHSQLLKHMKMMEQMKNEVDDT